MDGEVRAQADDSAELDAAGKGGAGKLFEVSADGRVFSRTFNYAQNLSGLPEYKLSGSYSGALQVVFHPGALLDGGAGRALAPVGITAALEYGLGVSSRSANSNQRLSSDVHGYALGLHLGAMFGDGCVAGHDRVDLVPGDRLGHLAEQRIGDRRGRPDGETGVHRRGLAPVVVDLGEDRRAMTVTASVMRR